MLRFILNPFIRFFLLFIMLSITIFGALDTTGIKARISNLVFETYIKMNPREASGQMKFVDIDDVSLSKVGQWPWPRTKIAEMITNINKSGAAVIIFDGVLAEPDRTSPDNIAKLLDNDHPAHSALSQMPNNDGVLADAIRNAENFVAGFAYGSNTKPPLLKRRILIKRDVKNFLLEQKIGSNMYFEATAQFLPELQKAAAGNGSFMATAESDAVIRRTSLVFHNGKQIYPSLMLEGIRIFENGGKEFIKISANEEYENYKISEPLTITIGEYTIPIGPDGTMWVYFRPFSKDEDVSAYRFLDKYYNDVSLEKPDLSDQIIFIASSAEGLMDLRATPLGMQAGVRVHMNALEQILQGKYLIRPYTSDILEIGAAASVSLLIILLSFFVNPIWLGLIALGVSGSAFWTSWYLFSAHGGLFDPVTPSIIVIIIFVVSAALSYLKTEYERRQVRDAFGLYISPDFMKELTSDPDKLQLGGEIKPLTVMFTDIRSFTTISEGLTPTELIQLMNDFLTPMSDLVMQNRGTIDKYMGDAMMAFWNAPLDDENHERNACISALQMNAALVPINEAVKKKAEEIGKEPVLLNAGIGINTGPCAVGNMGSKQRFAYSTLGDAVNLASRLEGQTKNYGVNILIGQETFNAIPDFAALEFDLIQVKGKSEPVHIYALLGNDTMANTESYQELKSNHEKMIAAYRSQDFETAIKYCEANNALKDWHLEVFYDMYIERSENMISNPPAKDWDGVFVATSK